MKKSIMLVMLCLIVNLNILAEIKNGYEAEIKNVQRALCNLQGILAEHDSKPQSAAKISFLQKKQIKATIEWLQRYKLYYELTERLLGQFRLIAPELYLEIDTIKDASGNPTDVFVKFLPKEEMQISLTGTTNVAQAKEDKNAYSSEYGDHTVSVKVAIRTQSLRLLAHELGHVRHQVPFLAKYLEYYNQHYHKPHLAANFIGHNTSDPSGSQALWYENRFHSRYRQYLKRNKEKNITPVVLLQTIKRSSDL